MLPLTEAEREKLCALIRAGESLPAQWRLRLFPGSAKSPEAGKEYRLVYDGKMRREEVLAQTPAAPWQLVRSFCTERPHADKRWRKETAALKQPTKEEDVNEVIDAVGFDFISQPQVEVKAKKRRDGLLKEIVLEIRAFRAQTLATDPEDFKNFETFSMAMVDLDYDGDVFRLGRVFWAEDLIAEEIKRIKAERKAAAKTKADKEKEPNVQIEDCELLLVRIPEGDFTGKKMMVILCDRYGNEKTLVFEKKDFK